MRTWRYLAAGSILAVVACGDGEQPQQNVVPAVTRDAQLLYTLQAGTEWIGAVGRDAQGRVSNAAARQFAATLAADHQGLHSAFEDAQRAELRPVESGVGQELITNAQTTRVGLQSLEGAAYDLAFVESTVRLQQQLLSAIERDASVLQDSALRRLAEQTRPTLQAHIQRGRQLLPELRAAESGAGAVQTASRRESAAGQQTGGTAAAPTTQGSRPQPTPRPPVSEPPPVQRDTGLIRQPVR